MPKVLIIIIFLFILSISSFTFYPQTVSAAGDKCTITFTPPTENQSAMEALKTLKVDIATDVLPTKQYRLRYIYPTDYGSEGGPTARFMLKVDVTTSLSLTRQSWRSGNYEVYVTEDEDIHFENVPSQALCHATFKVTESLAQPFCTTGITETYITPRDTVHLEVNNIKAGDYDIFINGGFLKRQYLGSGAVSTDLGAYQGSEPPIKYQVDIKNTCGIVGAGCIGAPARLQCQPTSFTVHTASAPTPIPSSGCSFKIFEVSPPDQQKAQPGVIIETLTYRTDCELNPDVSFDLYSPRDLISSPPSISQRYYPSTCNTPKSGTPPKEKSCDLKITIKDSSGDFFGKPDYGTYLLQVSGSIPGLSGLPSANFRVDPVGAPTSTPKPTPAFTIPTNPPAPQVTPLPAGGQECDPESGGEGTGGVATAIGCVPTDPLKLIQGLFRVASLAGGGIALLLMIAGAFQMITSAGNPENVKKGTDQFSNAAIGLLFIIFSVMLLQVIGVQILDIPGFE